MALVVIDDYNKRGRWRLGTKDKREARLRRNRRDVTLADLVAVLTAAGFTCRRGASGHWSCRHPSGAWCNLPEPHGRGTASLLPVYVDNALSALDEARAWEQEQAE